MSGTGPSRAIQTPTEAGSSGTPEAAPDRPASPGAAASIRTQVGGIIVLLDSARRTRARAAAALRRAGYEVVLAHDARGARDLIDEVMPDLLVCVTSARRPDGLGLMEHLLADPANEYTALLLVADPTTTEDAIARLGVEPADCLPEATDAEALVRRVRSKLGRRAPPAPTAHVPRTQLLPERRFWLEARRAVQAELIGCLAYVEVDELPILRAHRGVRAADAVVGRLLDFVLPAADPVGLVARDRNGRLLVLLPGIGAAEAAERLRGVAQEVVRCDFVVTRRRLRVTPVIGFASWAEPTELDGLRAQASAALREAGSRLDMEPLAFGPSLEPAGFDASATRRWLGARCDALRPVLQLLAVAAASLVLPFFAYAGLEALGLDVTWVVYLVLVVSFVVTGLLILVEGFLAVAVHDPAEPRGGTYPAASVIIAAYLPNEVATIVETTEAFLRIRYPGPLQIILAYNTPRDLPVEAVLRGMAAVDARLLPLRVDGSTSKAQNVNAALSEVSGEFVGLFDADHRPRPGSLTRAWCWLANGYDIVQGHCLVRDGDRSWVARMVAVEFEAIYAVSHPGRARMHGFGIFGGSNGYWKTDLLRQVRMQGTMLTEDIDSSMRAIEAGYRIASDPRLVSREEAPPSLAALCGQRLRWAQGWFQVSRKHFWIAMRSADLSVRQKAGIFHLLVWREIFPWLSVQMVPLVAYWSVKLGGAERLDWLVPLWVLTSLFTLSVGPGQTLFAYLLAEPEVRRHRSWFVSYLVVSTFFFSPLKNLIACIAQVKELTGERVWTVTLRGAVKRS